MTSPHTLVADIIQTLLGGETPTWPCPCHEAFIRQFEETATRHGVRTLLGHILSGSRNADRAPAGLLEALTCTSRLEALLERSRQTETRRMLDHLTAAGLPCLLLKGTALACLYYEEPLLRSRSDVDLFIRRADREAVDTLFRGCGYERPNIVRGEWITRQTVYGSCDRMHIAHTFDVHWAINNSPVLSPALTFDDCDKAAVAVPALGAHARTLRPDHALILACIHRASHMRVSYEVDGVPFVAGNRLIWLYDIHLLLQNMSRAELDAFARRTEQYRLKTICRDALVKTRECFGTPIPQHLLDRLEPDQTSEPSACYLQSSRAIMTLTEFWAIPGARNKLRYLRELAFPPLDYLLQKYHKRHLAWIPFLYFRRGAEGMRKVVSAVLSGHGARM